MEVSSQAVPKGEKIPPPAKVVPDGDSAPDSYGPDDGGMSASSFWSQVPSIQVLPRGTYFFIPPSGPGYYSLRDMVAGNYRQEAPKFPTVPFSIMPNSFFDADYRYLEDPNNTQFDFFDPLKRIHPNDNWMISFGGEERLRFANEENSRLSGKDNSYLLTRSRIYGDLWYKDIFRVYAEFLDARSTHQTLAPLLVDVDHADFLNLFMELKIWEFNDKPVYVRGGRQELLFGSQRLISPLDWVNTRRTFQGFRSYWRSEKVDVDIFGVQPVIPNATQLDEADTGQWFSGFWYTYRPQKGHFIDLYYLNLNNIHAVAKGLGGKVGGFNTSTIGSRYAGNLKGLLWDFEGMYQFGDWSNEQTSAGAVTTGLGYQFTDLPMMPTFWVFNDFASGDHNPGSHQHGTFNQLFPFGHPYFGLLDQVGRQNIDDLNLQANFYVTKWAFTSLQYHVFRLDSAKDALYNAAGAINRIDPTGKSGTDVGDEIDWFTNFHLTPHQDILVGYSQLFAGSFLKATAKTAAQARNAELFYVQYSFRW